MRRKLLITGGAGFIGSHLADILVGRGHFVCVIDNLSLGRRENIIHLKQSHNFRFYKNDLLDKKRIKKIFAENKFDTVFHLAANSDIACSYSDPSVDLNNTFFTTYNILEMMRQHSVRQIVFSSSSAVYGASDKPLDEDHGPLFPFSHYGAAKLASEAFIASYVENYNMKAWIARFPNVVGERATHGVIYDFINKLRLNSRHLDVLGNGGQNKPYLYVRDLIDALVFIWERATERINYFNIGVASRTKVSTIAKMVIEEMGVRSEIRYKGGERGWIGDVPQFRYDLKKIHSLGWKASMSSDNAVRTAIRAILGKIK